MAQRIDNSRTARSGRNAATPTVTRQRKGGPVMDSVGDGGIKFCDCGHQGNREGRNARLHADAMSFIGGPARATKRK
jgi:hypothetical protein